MIPVTPITDVEEQQGAGASNPALARRQLFIKLGLAAGGLLVLIAVVLGYVYNSYGPKVPEPVSHPGESHTERVCCLPDTSISQVLFTSPLRAVRILFSRHTLPAVAVTILLVVLVALAVTLPLVLQSTTKIPAPVEPVVDDDKDVTPIIEPEPEPGFFSKPLNLGLIGGIVVLGLIVIAGVVGRAIYKRRSGDVNVINPKDKPHQPLKPIESDAKATLDAAKTRSKVANDIIAAYNQFASTRIGKVLDFEKDCFSRVDNNEWFANDYVYFGESKLMTFKGVQSHDLKRYNQLFLGALDKIDPELAKYAPFILVMKYDDGKYVDCHDGLLKTEVPHAISLNHRKLVESDYDLEALLGFVQSLTPGASVSDADRLRNLIL